MTLGTAPGRRASEPDAGFTLVELLVVIAIIGTLAAIAGYSFSKTRDKSVESACRTDYKNIELSIEAFNTKNGKPPLQTQVEAFKGYPATNSGYGFTIDAAGKVAVVDKGKVVGGANIDGCRPK